MIARVLSLQDVTTARRFHAAGYWQDYTFYQRMAYWAQIQPDARALTDSVSSLTYAELRDWVDTYAQQLAAAGLRPGDRVAVWSPSRLESVITLLACSRMGYVCVPSLHRDHTPDGVMGILERTRASAIVWQRGYGASLHHRDIAQEAAALAHVRHLTVLDPLEMDGGPEVLRFGGLVSRAVPDLPVAGTDPDRIFYLAFTSGTTGVPKGVMHSDNTLLANGRAVARDFGFDTRTVVYTLSPMSHNMGTVSLAVTLACGGGLVMHGPLDAPRVVERVITTGASYLVGVPTHGIDLVSRIGAGRGFGRVRYFQLAGSPVPLRLAQAYMERGIVVQNCYGMTENCSFLYTRPDDTVDVITQTCGRCADGMEIAILDPQNGDCVLADGETGEVGIRGASMMLGYFDDQAATEQSYTDAGWFLSGDLGVRDRNGNIRIVGRKKDLIIRGGQNIHPARVEDLAMRHPAVVKAAAFGLPDDRLGEKMCLAVILRQNVAPADLLAHLAISGLAIYHMPEYVVALENFPLTASGKILKRELVAMVADGRLSPAAVRWPGKTG